MRFARIYPRTIAGQIAGLIVLSVAIAYLLGTISLYFFLSGNHGSPPPGAPRVQILTLARLAAAAKSTAEIETIVRSAKRSGFAVTWLRGGDAGSSLDSVNTNGMDNAFLRHFEFVLGAEALRDRLFLGVDGATYLRLGDGSVLLFPPPKTGGTPIAGFIMGPLFLTLLITGIGLIGISLYAAYFITAPLSSFADVALAVGRTTDSEQPIPERGPREIARVARALNEMRARIRGLLTERTNMLTAISHDLRTPLTRMKLRTERLVGTPNSIVADGMFADIARMEQMLSETLTYLRDDTQREGRIFADLPSVLQTICTEWADLGKTVTYEGPDRLSYFCKLGAMTRAVNNLVDNGIKYGTRVKIALRALPGGEIRIDVADDGPGIAYTYRNRVFEPFFKVDAARGTSGNEGFGLGLSIARNVVKEHGGSIDLLPVDPHGLNVRIILPAEAQPGTDAHSGY